MTTTSCNISATCSNISKKISGETHSARDRLPVRLDVAAVRASVSEGDLFGDREAVRREDAPEPGAVHDAGGLR